MFVCRREFLDRGRFAPTRLTTARQVVGITKKALAELLNISAVSITQYEGYEHEPLESTVKEIAEHLRFPVQFFYAKELNLVDPEAVTFRSRRSMTSRLRERATGYSAIATDVISPTINSRFRLPEPNVPDLSDHDPQEAAAIMRSHWKLGQGPLANTVHLLESRGVEVYWINEESPSVSAFSRWKDKRPYVFLNSYSPSGERGRFDAMHELAHLVLHNNVDGKNLDSRSIEAEADTFASAFLMPSVQFKSECPRIPTLKKYVPLKKRWGVSFAAMIRRSKDVGHISSWQYECFCREISKEGWRVQEPYALIREHSAAYHFVMKTLKEKGTTPEEFAQSLDLPFRHLEALMPVATEYHEKEVFEDDPYDLNLLKTIHEQSSSNDM